MGQIRFEKINNYFFVTDVDSGQRVFDPIPSKDIRYVLDRESILFYGIGRDRTKHGFKDGFLIGLTGTVNLDSGGRGSRSWNYDTSERGRQYVCRWYYYLCNGFGKCLCCWRCYNGNGYGRGIGYSQRFELCRSNRH